MEKMMNAVRLSTPAGVLALACAVLTAGCASEPLGPTVQVYPAQGKPWDVFLNDQAQCKDYASQQVAGQVDRANENGVGAAVIGTALGAGLGAAVGGGRGAAIGAGAGAVVGSDVGATGSMTAQQRIQYNYNNAYSQCMYAKGDQVVHYQPRVYYAAPPPPPPPAYYPAPPPPPPPGYYPPPQ
jgi:uncharacterized protein YcfJ